MKTIDEIGQICSDWVLICAERIPASSFRLPGVLGHLFKNKMEKLWIDKYRPKKLEDLHYHTELSGKLSKLAECNNFPHLLFYGPSGAGKKTRIMCFL